MLTITITSEIMAVLICTIILFALHVTDDGSESSTLFFKLVRVTLVGVCGDLIYYIIRYVIWKPVYTIPIALAIIASYSMSYVCFYTMTEYIECVAVVKDEKRRRLYKATRWVASGGICYVLLIAIYLIIDLEGFAAKADYIFKPYYYAVGITFLMISTGLIASRKQIEAKYFKAFAAYMGVIFVSGFITVAGPLADENLSYAATTLSLLVQFVIIQVDAFSLHRDKAVRDALNIAEETNAMLEENLSNLEKERRTLSSIADIYNTMYEINLKTGQYHEMGGVSSRVSNFITEEGNASVQDILWAVTKKTTDKAYLEDALEYTNLSTLPERMKGERVLFFESVDDNGRWFRFSFIRVGKVEDELTSVIYTSLNIDFEKKKEARLLKMSNTDGLTKLFNRNAYVQAIKELDREGIPDNFWYIEVDLNGLKWTNDNLGHEAGDELLVGAAECLKKSTGRHGKVYRIGGDEFAILMKTNPDKLMTISDNWNAAKEEWNKKHNANLSFSIGHVCATEVEKRTIANLAKIADERMYEAKRRYYAQNKDKDLRGQASQSQS